MQPKCSRCKWHSLPHRWPSHHTIKPPVRFPLHMNVLCRNHIERRTDPVIFRETDQTLPNGLWASTECFAFPSTPNYQLTIAPLCWKIDLRKRTGQSCTSLMPQFCPIMPYALESSWHV
ncbi:hypothetical protein O181_068596 [Austropuccinia psidii MF-1]|uniref:Uncharacterized protein n=1 Tax=Austropuccinia psidii MF-1 TaxID=1389203 RepID=A0A9Q3I423_9BASI|nr:hypothetical protein [Austropuccinia psidii MF-1]